MFLLWPVVNHLNECRAKKYIFSAVQCVSSQKYLSFLQACAIQTPQGQEYKGRRFSGKGVNLCVWHIYFQYLNISYLIGIILVFVAAPVFIISRSQVCPFFGQERPWSLHWEPCGKMSVLARFWFRLIWIQENQR